MSETDVRAAFDDAADFAAGLLDEVTDWSRPGLGEWDIGGLGGHLVRGAAGPSRNLAPEAESGPPGTAADYFLGYLEVRQDVAADVAARARQEIGDGDPHDIPAAFREAAQASVAALASHPPSTPVVSGFGTLPLDEYTRTRVLELTVHGLDLAAALGRPDAAPPSGLTLTLTLLTEIAVADPHKASHLIGALTGRSWAEPGTAMPVLS